MYGGITKNRDIMENEIKFDNSRKFSLFPHLSNNFPNIGNVRDTINQKREIYSPAIT